MATKKVYQKIINCFLVRQGTFSEKGIKFIKGINLKTNQKTKKVSPYPFLNVASLNNKINDFVKVEFAHLVNTKIGDILLSLDGTIGLVNNNLEGVNGYAYKLKSKKVDDYLIYFSLLTQTNQKLMKAYAHGTTILHAAKAKSKILLFDFAKQNQLLAKLYDYEKELKLILKKINIIIFNLINLLL